MEWATTGRGSAPARDFFETLSDEDKAKLLALFQRFADFWKIESRETFKSLGREGGDLWEFKKFQLRFSGDFRTGYRFLIAHGLRKKQDRHLRSDIATAIRVLRESDEAEEHKK